MDQQTELLEQDKDFRGVDVLTRKVHETEAEFNADPSDMARLKKYIAALEATEDSQYENRAIEVLDDAYERTKQFWMRQKLGAIRLKQLGRMDRSLREEAQKNPGEESLKKEYLQFVRERASRNWTSSSSGRKTIRPPPTSAMTWARGCFSCSASTRRSPSSNKCAPTRNIAWTPAFTSAAAFLESEYLEEAVDTLKGVIEEHPQADEKSMNMGYGSAARWRNRARPSRH